MLLIYIYPGYVVLVSCVVVVFVIWRFVVGADTKNEN
jgi:hypothetical protein